MKSRLGDNATTKKSYKKTIPKNQTLPHKKYLKNTTKKINTTTKNQDHKNNKHHNYKLNTATTNQYTKTNINNTKNK